MGLLSAAPSAPPETPDETIRRLTAELHEAHDQQAATIEILEIINRSGGDLAPVFDAILEKAHSLCGAAHGAPVVRDGDRFRAVATRGFPKRFAEMLRQPFPSDPGAACERLLQGERLVHVADQAASERTYPIARASVEAGGRTLLLIPLRKDSALLGYVTAARLEVRPFTDKQIALLRELRGAGGHRDGECAAHHRDARGIGAADRDRRGIAGHQLLARRPSPRCSTRYWRRRTSFAVPLAAHLWLMTTNGFAPSRRAECRNASRSTCAAGSPFMPGRSWRAAVARRPSSISWICQRLRRTAPPEPLVRNCKLSNSPVPARS